MESLTLEQASYLAEIIGVIAVVISLLFLSLQIRQNTKSIQGQAITAVASVSLTEIAPMVDADFGPVFRKSIDEPEKLTLDEMSRLNARNVMFMVSRENQFALFQYGMLDELGWAKNKYAIQSALTSRWHRNWWNVVGRNMFAANFVQLVDDILESSEWNMESGFFENLRVK